ncbi:Glutathione reductase [Venturia nashicola]|uniref:Glutathione reductase n=1 Tax=Venturia nashicola TaxID=86259 RepID=A0A4Z1P4F3_9PEZI|nr:Glutathione reductase [Venturia nashicola]
MGVTGDAPYTAPSRKRKAKDISQDRFSAFASSSGTGRKVSQAIDLTGDDDEQYAIPPLTEKPKRQRRAKHVDEDATFGKSKPAAKKAKMKAGDNEGEQRLKKYRATMPGPVAKIMERATTQRIFVIERVRGGTMDIPTETISIAGTTGNVYTITIDQIPSCDCPHAAKGKQCKHILFSLSRVLRARENLTYQLALLPSELREIFAGAPPINPVDVDTTDKNRKPICDDDNCPICFMEFDDGFEDTVYCKAACGNNVHKECFDQWAASRKKSSASVTCPFCRSNWAFGEEDVVKKVKRGVKTSEGYVNVAEQLGVSTTRGKYMVS